jgi:hypothetical protein
MKLSNLIQPAPKRVMKILINESQFRRLANSVCSLLQEEKIMKTYLINKKSNGQ